MLRLTKDLYKTLTATSSLLSLAVSYGTDELKKYVDETKEVNTSIKTAVNLRKVETILDKMSDIRDMDIPQSAKDLALAKLQTMLETELK